ncbi:MAG TPA: type II secretion system minor pseudopilin GspK [Desulfuromonadales bacterium]|nr:type II secretion system minor pseudopilin GspK [Desulfuromonadales bacterium]
MKSCVKGESGFALVLTLVVTALMVAVAVEMIHQVYVDTSLSRGFRDGQQASILAESGVTGAAKLLQTGLSGRSYTSLSDPWAAPIKLQDEAGSIEIQLSEESGKININGLVQPNGVYDDVTLNMLKRVGKRFQMPEDIWGSLADWIDSDDLPRSGGVENAFYRSLRPGYSARNDKLSTIKELTLVNGFTTKRYGDLLPFITIYSDQAGAPVATININTAPKEVLTALDDRIDERMAERIVAERRLQPFKSTAELARVPGLDTIAIGLVGRISVKGNLFHINCVARSKDAVRTVEAVVRMSSGAAEFLTWQEH